MKKAEIQIGAFYRAKVGGGLVIVEILREDGKGWVARNTKSKRLVGIKSAQKLRPLAGTRPDTTPPPEPVVETPPPVETAPTPVVEPTIGDWGTEESESQRVWREASERAEIERQKAEAEYREKRAVKNKEKLAAFKAKQAADRERVRQEREQAKKDAQVEIEEFGSTTISEEEITMTAATKKKPASKKPAKAKTAKPKAPRKPKQTQAEMVAALKAKYPHMQEVIEWSENGKPSRVRIKCDKKCPECEKTREIWSQDLFQVKHCEPCKVVAKKVRKVKAPAKPKKKAK